MSITEAVGERWQQAIERLKNRSVFSGRLAGWSPERAPWPPFASSRSGSSGQWPRNLRPVPDPLRARELGPVPAVGTVVGAAAIGGAIAVGYMRLVRPWQLGWGATQEERGRLLPGDDLVKAPTFDATRAITIGAKPDAIWPWLVQVGVKRAGWYSYDLLDNLGRPSAREIIPELQDIKVGDVMPMSPDGRHGILVHALDPPYSMIWGTPDDTSWAWLLDSQPDGTTRLITRVRSRYRWLSPSIGFSMLLEFADIWMMRRMLLNLRERVETTAESTTTPARP